MKGQKQWSESPVMSYTVQNHNAEEWGGYPSVKVESIDAIPVIEVVGGVMLTAGRHFQPVTVRAL